MKVLLIAKSKIDLGMVLKAKKTGILDQIKVTVALLKEATKINADSKTNRSIIFSKITEKEVIARTNVKKPLEKN